MPRILIAYLTRHSGHHSAALALEAAFRRLDPRSQIMCVDPLEYTRPYLSTVIEKTYMIVLKQTPEVWEALYDSRPLDTLTRRVRWLIQRGSSRKFLRMMDVFRPDIVVCTQAYPFGVMSAYKRRFGVHLPLYGVVTDYWPHRFWVHEGDGRYFLPSKNAAVRLAALGVGKERMTVHGIPIDPSFEEAAGTVPAPAERRILVMGGSRGLGVKYRTIRGLDKSGGAFVMDIVTGKNDLLRRRLLSRHRHFLHPMRVRGYVRDVRALMRQATLLVGKAGGLTSAEAMAVGLPMLIVRPLPGQETRNMTELALHGAALHVKRDREVAPVIDLLLNNEELLTMLRQRARAFGRPEAARRIASDILNDN